ncbi:MAG: nucleotide exchange factor GrpE [Bacteroidales bacterium]|nr:nucleotide exchange factor GrpE [Bacteroidales bacterium]
MDNEATEAKSVEGEDLKEDAEKNEHKEDQKEESDKEAEVLSENDELAKMSMQLADMKDKYLRLSAEFDNYRKRTLKEKMELTKSAGSSILLNVLPVVDNFERALKSIDDAKEIDAVKQGIELIYTTFIDFLKQQGVHCIDAINQDFNTDEHEALTKIPSPKPELKGKVVDVVEKGYKLHDKVIRFSKVVVGE